MNAAYIVPLRLQRGAAGDEFISYLDRLSAHIDVVLVDGSPPVIFDQHHRALPPRVLHIPVDPALATPNGKVGGVLTGIRHTSHGRVVIADDDVRYDWTALQALLQLLDRYAVVRPQNYFQPCPWHAHLDTGRTLINRVTGGDWPGTLGVRRSYLEACGGYDGSVLFENLELVRTITAAGGRELVPRGLYVRRLPTSSRHFLSQRIRQAYDEFARPHRMLLSLAALPVLLLAIATDRRRPLAALALLTIGVAEAGRRVEGGTAYFSPLSTLFAPLWILERAITSWLALGMRVLRGGVTYRGTVIRQAATPLRTLRVRHGHLATTLAGASR